MPEFSTRRQESAAKTAALGSLMNQEGQSRTASADSLPDLMGQGARSKRGAAQPKAMRSLMGQ